MSEAREGIRADSPDAADAFEAGRVAYFDGTLNPYEPGTPEAEEFDRGYLFEQRRVLSRVRLLRVREEAADYVTGPVTGPAMVTTTAPVVQGVQGEVCALMPTVRILARSLARRTGYRMEAEDLAQEGALALVAAAARFDPTRGARFATYGAMRARGAMIDAIRRASGVRRCKGRLRRREVERTPLADGLAVAADDPVTAVEDADERAWVRGLVARLPQRDQRVLWARAQGVTLREVAASEGVSITRLVEIERRARRRAREVARAGRVAEDAPAYPEEDHHCPICETRAHRREAPASCALVEHLDERGAVTEWDVEDITEEAGDIYLTCERGHIWVARSREVIDEVGDDAKQAALLLAPAPEVRDERPAYGTGSSGPATRRRTEANVRNEERLRAPFPILSTTRGNGTGPVGDR